jgi:predicted metal-dependent hydrolase
MARELFKKGLYFEVHEILEEVWMGEFGEYRDFLQALIQVGVAYYHRENFNERGFKLLLENALELLSCYNGEVLGVKVDKLKEDIKRAKEEGTLIEF